MDMEVPNETVGRIYAAWEKAGRAEPKRLYLGASICGHECDRFLWLYFRGMFNERFDGRMYRLFDRGRREEAVFVQDLRNIGCEVWEVDPANGKQWEVKALGGHFSGHLDGVCVGVPEAQKTPHVTEFKTHNDASFTKLKKIGVREAKPMHFAQMQVYMLLMNLTRALYLAVNKDTDELYAERIDFDKAFANAVLIRAKRIIELPNAERVAKRKDDFRCKACPARAVCWHETGTVFSCPTGIIDCRSCCHATAETEGSGARWSCRLGHECVIGRNCDCSSHLVLPLLMDADLDTATEMSVTYRAGGNSFTNGTANGQFVSRELAKIGREPLANGSVQKIREILPGSRVTAQFTIKAEIDAMNIRTEAFHGTVEELGRYMSDKPWQVVAREKDETENIEWFKFDTGVCLVIKYDDDEANIYVDMF